MKKKKKKRCLWCQRVFIPHPRLKDRQKSCGDPECKRKQKHLSQQLWMAKEREAYVQNQRDWRKNNPDYWQEYRSGHPEYVVRNRNRSRVRKSLRRVGLQKRIDILQLSEKQMEFWSLGRFAKSTRSIFLPIHAYQSRHEHSACDLQRQSP